MTLKGVAKFKRKLTCGLKNDTGNFFNFPASSWKSENLHFDWIHLSKAYKHLDEKVEKSYVSWHWSVMQSLKKIWSVLMWAVASLEICTLMYNFCQKHLKFQPKKYKRMISHDTEKRSKLWRQTDFLFEKWHGEFSEL